MFVFNHTQLQRFFHVPPSPLFSSSTSSSNGFNLTMFLVCVFSFVKLQRHIEEYLYPTRDVWWQLWDCSIISKLWQSHIEEQLHSDVSSAKQWTWRDAGTKSENNEHRWNLQDINYWKRYAVKTASSTPRNFIHLFPQEPRWAPDFIHPQYCNEDMLLLL